MHRSITLGLVFCSLAFAPSAFSQTFIRETYAIPFSDSSGGIGHPFTGGFYNPIHQFVDIDSDADFDLFLLDNNDLSTFFYRNIGTPQTAILREQQPEFVIPRLQGWFRFHDVNGDGKIDLLTKGNSLNTIAVYENTGTESSPVFSLMSSELLDSASVTVYNQEQCIPELADIDCDGDLDFFSLNPGSGTINLYQNIGGPSNLLLAFRTDFWQNIRICPGCRSEARPDAHGQGSLYFADLDNDSDNDMLYGDLFSPGLFYYENVGTCSIATLDSVSGYFPPGDSIITGGFNQPTVVDIDADGDLDMFVSVLGPFQQVDNMYFYRNNGTTSSFDFELVTKNYLPTVDMGLQSAPAFVDIDGDGDQDLAVGDLFGHVRLARNIGTANSPSFLLEDSTLVESLTEYSYAPTFADIDADNDMDMFLGEFSGKVKFFRNNGTATQPLFQFTPSFFDSIAVGTYAAPVFHDLDGDGDLDLFVGRGNGRISHYENVGTPQQYQFVLVTQTFQNINVTFNAKPVFQDVNDNDLADLIIGNSDGEMFLYANNGPPGNPVFFFVTNDYAAVVNANETAPVFIDIDNDGDPDLFLGGERGGVEFYKNDGFVGVDEEPAGLPSGHILLPNYPNPFNPSTTIHYEIGVTRGSATSHAVITVHNVLGETVAQLVDEDVGAGTYSVVWNAEGFSSGVYFARLFVDGKTLVTPMLLIR